MQARTAVTAFYLVACASGAVIGGAWAGTAQTASYGVTKDGATVHIFTMTNNHGMRAQVLDYGGTPSAPPAPGRGGKMAKVIPCRKDLAGNRRSGPTLRVTRRRAHQL